MFSTLILAGLCITAQIYTYEPTEINAYLQKLQQDKQGYSARVTQIAIDTLGTTYQDGPLGEGVAGTYDKDPLIDLSKVDCVTYVEQTCALALGSSFEDSVNILQKIRYQNGNIDFETRNHFMVGDWVQNNPWCRDISHELGVDTVELTRTISKKEFFPKVDAPKLGQEAEDQKITIHYIPIDKAAEVENKISGPAIIVFIGKIDWLFALHCGLHLSPPEDKPKLFHASSKAGKVVSVPLSQYAKEQASRYLGFTVYQIEEPVLK